MQFKKWTKTEPLGRLSLVSAEQPCFRPKEATFPLNIDTGFIVIAAGTSHTASLGNLYSMVSKQGISKITIFYVLNFEVTLNSFLKLYIYVILSYSNEYNRIPGTWSHDF